MFNVERLSTAPYLDWNNDKRQNVCYAQVSKPEAGGDMCDCVFIYVPPHGEDKESFWRRFSEYVNNLCLPFVILDDLNQIQNDDEKMGGTTPNFTRFQRWISLRNDCELIIDIPKLGDIFTWRKNQTELSNT